jgi:hypothetical protein
MVPMAIKGKTVQPEQAVQLVPLVRLAVMDLAARTVPTDTMDTTARTA